MANQIHGIVLQAKHLDRWRLCRFTASIQHELLVLPATPRHVECHQASSDAVSGKRKLKSRLDFRVSRAERTIACPMLTRY